MKTLSRILTQVLLLSLLSGGALAFQEGQGKARHLTAGIVELGIAGAFTSVEGTVETKVGVRGGTFFAAPGGFWGAEGDASYAYVRSLHQLDLEANFSWTAPVELEGIFPYLALAGGIRLEKVGSYEQTLVPLGVTAGLRVLATESVGVRLDVKFRRVLNDPVQDFTEINLVLGLSLFLRP
jgi:hypothetical protein